MIKSRFGWPLLGLYERWRRSTRKSNISAGSTTRRRTPYSGVECQPPHAVSEDQPAPYVRYPPSVIYMRCRTCTNVTTVTTTWTNIKSSSNIITGGGSAILSIPCDRESCDHARDQQRVVTPGGFRRTRPPLPDLKFIRSILSYVNTARLNRIGKSDTLPDMVIRHKLM